MLNFYLPGRAKPIELLVNKSADVNAKTMDGKTSLHTAAVFGLNFYLEFCFRLTLIK